MVRFKNRYLLCEVCFEDGLIAENLNSYAILNAFKDSIETNFGDVGMGTVASSLQVKYYSPFTNLAIVRIGRDYARHVWAAATLITAVKKRKCMVRVLHVAGTIKLVQKHGIEHNKRMISELRAQKALDGACCSSCCCVCVCLCCVHVVLASFVAS
ncbi:hypothetical protein BC831DRAFT_399841 [Entophlyctis helioformis]|nr:hypothetical protein BC831DRAFT_399841 [Entophlyctis helioformis]